jgi:hypothetical protein
MDAKFTIEEPFLRAALTGENMDDNNELISILAKNNWTRNARGSLGSVYLTYLVSKLFNIYRFPCFDDLRMVSFAKDHCFSSSSESETLNPNTFFQNIPLIVVRDSLNELKRLYDLTQERLKSQKESMKYDICNDKILLFRGLFTAKEAKYVWELFHKTKNEKKDNFLIHTNTLISFYFMSNSVSRNGKFYTHPYCPVSIKKKVNISDILLVGHWVEGMENDEWIVVNHHPRGELVLHIDEVLCNGCKILCNETVSDYLHRVSLGLDDIAYYTLRPLLQDNTKIHPRLGLLIKCAVKIQSYWVAFRKIFSSSS